MIDSVDLIKRARRSLENLSGAGRFDDRQLLEMIRLGGPASAESVLVVVANELAARLRDRSSPADG